MTDFAKEIARPRGFVHRPRLALVVVRASNDSILEWVDAVLRFHRQAGLERVADVVRREGASGVGSG